MTSDLTNVSVRNVRRISLAIVFFCLTGATLLLAKAPPEPASGALTGQRYRVLVSSDIGGSDEDDMQSLVHLLCYADLFDIEGLVSSPPGKGRVQDFLEIIEVYGKDYPKLNARSKRFPAPDFLRKVTKQGATLTWKEAGSGSTEGSRWIVQQAKKDDSRPLYVLVWGAITDVAQAIKDDPSIKSRIRVYFIASWNRRADPEPFDYLHENHPNMWMIVSEGTFRGWYRGGHQDEDLGNRSFVQEHIKGHGALGDYFVPLKRGSIKMGDTPSVAYLLRGTPEDPTAPSWGGSYKLHPDGKRKTWWVDLDRRDTEGKDPQESVSRYREHYLRDWQRRLDWLK